MQLSPQTIRKLNFEHGMITPFREHYQHEASGLSGGLSCAGYDIHLKNLAKASNEHGEDCFIGNPVLNDGLWYIPPRTGVLGVTEERFNLPKDVAMSYFNKSTLARWFTEAAATLAEPGWCGHLTLELYNASDFCVTLQEGQPIGQVVFNQLDQPSESAYSGKYQNQKAEPVQGLRFKEAS